jgi:HlyD family type I secretion membrane fusion protein
MNAKANALPAVPSVKSDHRLTAIGGYVVIFLTFGLFGGWAATAPLDSAVIAPGTMVAESNRKTLQHFEGGIVREINVRDGQHVKEGDTLFRLDDVQARANLDLLQNQFDSTRVLEARLIAEREFLPALVFPADILAKRDNPHVAQAIADQTSHFNERRASLTGQIEIMESRIAQLEREASGLEIELAALREQVRLINEELVDMRGLLRQNLIQRPRVFAHEREKARLEGSIGRSEAEIAKANNNAAEMRLQIRQLRQKFAEEVSAQVAEVRQRLSDIGERSRVARDVLARTVVVAPQSGVVQGLRVFTLGAVVRPAEPLLDIAPDEDKFYVNAQFAPTDVDKIPPGAVTEVRFPSFPVATTPIISGRVKSVSRDRLIDEATRMPYFMVQVEVEMKDVPPALHGRLHAGIPADVVVPTGERTLLAYMIKPLTDRINRSMREQ